MVLRMCSALPSAGALIEMLAICRGMLDASDADVATLLDIGALLSSYGFPADARACYEKAQAFAPNDLRATINLANLARDAGEHAEARRLREQLLHALPDHPVVRRNALTSSSNTIPRRWMPNGSRRPRHGAIGPSYAQAVFARAPSCSRCRDTRCALATCRPISPHTVGLFVKDVLKAHDTKRVQVFSLQRRPSQGLGDRRNPRVCTFRDVTALDDAALATQIRADGIDVLVDLSGHTAGVPA